MTISELEKKLMELEKRYEDKEIVTEEGIVCVYYTFKAGQIGWEKYFDGFTSTKKNFKKAKEYIAQTFGYCGRDSSLTAIKKCYLVSEDEKNVFKFSNHIYKGLKEKCNE